MLFFIYKILFIKIIFSYNLQKNNSRLGITKSEAFEISREEDFKEYSAQIDFDKIIKKYKDVRIPLKVNFFFRTIMEIGHHMSILADKCQTFCKLDTIVIEEEYSEFEFNFNDWLFFTNDEHERIFMNMLEDFRNIKNKENVNDNYANYNESKWIFSDTQKLKDYKNILNLFFNDCNVAMDLLIMIFSQINIETKMKYNDMQYHKKLYLIRRHLNECSRRIKILQYKLFDVFYTKKKYECFYENLLIDIFCKVHIGRSHVFHDCFVKVYSYFKHAIHFIRVYGFIIQDNPILTDKYFIDETKIKQEKDIKKQKLDIINDEDIKDKYENIEESDKRSYRNNKSIQAEIDEAEKRNENDNKKDQLFLRNKKSFNLERNESNSEDKENNCETLTNDVQKQNNITQQDLQDENVKIQIRDKDILHLYEYIQAEINEFEKIHKNDGQKAQLFRQNQISLNFEINELDEERKENNSATFTKEVQKLNNINDQTIEEKNKNTGTSYEFRYKKNINTQSLNNEVEKDCENYAKKDVPFIENQMIKVKINEIYNEDKENIKIKNFVKNYEMYDFINEIKSYSPKNDHIIENYEKKIFLNKYFLCNNLRPLNKENKIKIKHHRFILVFVSSTVILTNGIFIYLIIFKFVLKNTLL